MVGDTAARSLEACLEIDGAWVRASLEPLLLPAGTARV